MKQYATIEKSVGETPLQAIERFRHGEHIAPDIPLTYAGRLDPMASGKLLILIGDECKAQHIYHELDKEYCFTVLFGVRSDTGDVLGLVEHCTAQHFEASTIRTTLDQLIGDIALPYPPFSSKTVLGKPLHTWTLEGRLNEITIPTNYSHVYRLQLEECTAITKKELYALALAKIDSLPKVTEPSKALRHDFRRADIKATWKHFLDTESTTHFQIATVRCTATSGTYMRSLAEEIARQLGTCGLALSIHRTKIGRYQPIWGSLGFWRKTY